jgi:hypothetical protein
MPFTQDFSQEEDDEDDAERLEGSVESCGRVSRVEDLSASTSAEQATEHAPGAGAQIWGFGFRVSGVGFRVSGFGFRLSGFGFRASGL